MGKKKKAKKEMKPWCWYCDREFEDEKVLINHQKAKHFQCTLCHRRLNTAGGLGVHAMQVHKETIRKIENALPGRDNPDIEIFGMEGVPDDDMARHIEEVEARDNPNKKPRLDGPSMPGGSIPAYYPGAGMPSAYPGMQYPGAPPMPPYGMPGAMMPPRPGMPPFPVPPAMGFPTGPPVMPGFPQTGMPPFPMPGTMPMPGMPMPPMPPMQPPTMPPATTGTLAPPVMPPSLPAPPTLPAPPAASADAATPVSAANAGGNDAAQNLSAEARLPIAGEPFLIYDDNEISVEEKRARLQLYRVVEDEED